jgi:CelD/BcsL family acetyltransferase involved in cellulose biosynthesis
MGSPRQGLLLDASDRAWKAMVESAPHATTFHHPAWMSLLAECYGYRPFVVAVGNEADGICAGLPFMEVNSPLTGRRWVSLPYTDYCRPLCNDCASLDGLTGELVSLFQTAGIPRIEIRWELPANPLIQAHSSYVMHTLKLEMDATRVFERFHRTQRQNARTAEKHGVRVERGDSLEHLRQFYSLHCATRRRQGVPVQPWKFFELLSRHILAKSLGFVLLAYVGETCLAAGLFLNGGHTLTYKYAASADEGQDLRANHLLTWTAMQWGCEHGFTEFDFGRTDLANEGLHTFKKRWGAVEAPLTYSTLSAAPLRFTTGRLASVMQPVIRNSPLWVCRTAGELLYRHFG